MKDTCITLSCLLDGEPVQTASSIEIESTKYVTHLKSLIGTNLDNPYYGVNFNKLILWRVTIPDDHQGCFHLNKTLDGNKALMDYPSQQLCNLFPSGPDAQAYIIIQRPLPFVYKKLFSVAYDHVVNIIFQILETTFHPVVPEVNPKEAEAYQRKILGPFYKTTLPYHKTAQDICLVKLGLQLGKQAKSKYQCTLRTTIEEQHFDLIYMVAPSGFGKTATIVDLANDHFVIYFTCCTLDKPPKTFPDPNFAILASHVEKLYLAAVDSERNRNPQHVGDQARSLAHSRVCVEYLARLLFLKLLLDRNPDLTPPQFFREQTIDQGATTIGQLVEKLLLYHTGTIEQMIVCVHASVKDVIARKRRKLVIALDDAQVAMKDILAGKLIMLSERGFAGYLHDATIPVPPHSRKSFFSPLSATLSRMEAPLVMLGTDPSLLNNDPSNIKVIAPSKDVEFFDFPTFDKTEVWEMLSSLLNLSSSTIQPDKLTLLAGRPGFSIGVIQALIDVGRAHIAEQGLIGHHDTD